MACGVGGSADRECGRPARLRARAVAPQHGASRCLDRRPGVAGRLRDRRVTQLRDRRRMPRAPPAAGRADVAVGPAPGAYLLARKLRERREDPRYGVIRERHGERFALVSLASVFLLQGALLWIVSLPIQAAAPQPDRLGV